MTGIYFLFYKKKLVYIGQTTKWPTRILNHNVIKFDSVRFIECSISKLDEYELRAIKRFKPKFNVEGLFKIKYKMPDQWIIDNKILVELAQKSEDRRAFIEIARKDNGYSATISSSDLWQTITNKYTRIFGHSALRRVSNFKEELV